MAEVATFQHIGAGDCYICWNQYHLRLRPRRVLHCAVGMVRSDALWSFRMGEVLERVTASNERVVHA